MRIVGLINLFCAVAIILGSMMIGLSTAALTGSVTVAEFTCAMPILIYPIWRLFNCIELRVTGDVT